jgi:hypothetical protein
MLTRGGKICDWIEGTCRIPEGRYVGEHMVLLNFQRDFIDAIYNNAQAKCPIAPPAREIEDVLAEIDEHDTAALTLAMDAARAQGRGRQLDEMLQTRSWQRVASPPTAASARRCIWHCTKPRPAMSSASIKWSCRSANRPSCSAACSGTECRAGTPTPWRQSQQPSGRLRHRPRQLDDRARAVAAQPATRAPMPWPRTRSCRSSAPASSASGLR